jgi:pyroglutamyl-peptidase
MKKILITGFEPFGNEPINPSREVALSFQDHYDVLILPVSYQRAIQTMKSQMQAGEYDFVLMMGQAGGRQWIDLERVAINLEDSENPDEDGDLRIQSQILLEGPDAFLNPLPLRDFVQTLQRKKAPVQISFSAGAFVCNSLYYQVFQWIKSNGRNTHALFVHLPYLPEQVIGKNGNPPSLTMETMRSTILELIQLVQS